MLSPRLDRFRPLLAAGLFSAALAAVPLSSSAATVQSTTSKFTGSPPSVSITIDDPVDPGNLVIALEIESADPTGDLRGFFAHVSDESLLPCLSGRPPADHLYTDACVRDVDDRSL